MLPKSRRFALGSIAFIFRGLANFPNGLRRYQKLECGLTCFLYFPSGSLPGKARYSSGEKDEGGCITKERGAENLHPTAQHDRSQIIFRRARHARLKCLKDTFLGPKVQRKPYPILESVL